MISFNFFAIISIIVLVLLILVCIRLCCKRKGIGYKKYLDLMDIGKELYNQIQNYRKRRTMINLIFINLGKGKNYDRINCEWLNSDIEISNLDKFECELKNDYDFNERNIYIDSFVKQKIELISWTYKKIFYLDVYLHQINNFYIVTNIHNNQEYSLDTIYYAKNKYLIPNKINFDKLELLTDNYGINNMGRNCLINIEKKSIIKFINRIAKLNINENDNIFKSDVHDIFLNIRIKNDESFQCSLFLNKINEEQYNFTPQEIEIIKRFNNEIIKKYIGKYKNVKFGNITDEMESNFLNSIGQFILTNFPDEEQKPENGNISKESIPRKNEETENEIINNLIESSNEQLEKKFDLSLNIQEKGKVNALSSLKLEKMLSNFFNTPFDKRFINEPSKEDLKMMECVCYLDLSISALFPLASIISFHNFKNEILNKNKEFSLKEKMKIISCIRTHLGGCIPSKIKLQKMIDLPEYSPYLSGEIMYRNIIKNLNESSILNFIFLQLNSGSGYDFIKHNKCYLLKMIPLIVIKSHLLYISDDYFLIYSNNRARDFSFMDPYTKIISINEIKVFDSEGIAFTESEDNSIKVGLLQFHEKGGHKKYGKLEDSPRFLISNDLDLYDNLGKDATSGESGNALEVILLGNTDYISSLMLCKNLKKLADYNLFTQKSGKTLLKEIEKILEKNGINATNSKKNLKHISFPTIEGDKYIILKRYGRKEGNELKK